MICVLFSCLAHETHFTKGLWVHNPNLVKIHVAVIVKIVTKLRYNFAHVTVSWAHYDDVIMTMLASQITSLTVVYSIVYSGVNQRKHQSSASLAFVREIHRGPVNFPHRWPVTRKMFPFDDVIMHRDLIGSLEFKLKQRWFLTIFQLWTHKLFLLYAIW